MQRLLASVDTGAIGIPLFVTLTYPDEFPRSSRTWKEHLRAFRERLKRRYGKFPAIWRLEVMDRKSGKNAGLVAPHFHLLLFLDQSPRDMYFWLSQAWYEVVGSGDVKHLSAGTRVELPDTWRGARSYLSKYVAKTEKLQALGSVGRLWGVWFKNLLPIGAAVVKISVREFIKLRRVMRRFAGLRSTSQLRGLGCFVDYSTSSHLVGWMRC